MVEREALVLKEIDVIQAEIARFDNNGLTVKSWCLAVWAATIAYGVEHQSGLVTFTAVVTTVSFSIVELMYRRYQLRFIARSKCIEDLLAGQDLQGYQYDVHHSAIGQRGDCRLRSELRGVLRMPHFTLFYLILISFAVACTVYAYGLVPR
jgi:hypothetical protein